jgi:membrane protease YdiL (CAAX protease family)
MFAIFVILVSFIGVMFLSLAIAIPFFGMDALFDMASIGDLSDPRGIQFLKYLQIAQSVGLFIIPPFILAWLYHDHIPEYLYLDKTVDFASVLLVFVLFFAAAPFINFIGELNGNMRFPEWMAGIEDWMKNAEEQAEMLTRAFLKVDNPGGLFFNLFMIAVLPALGEELLFRGVIQKIFIQWTKNVHWGIWISAILFSALHLQFYGFIPRMLLGVAFGYMLVWSGSIWLPIAAHFFNNGIAVVAVYLIDKGLLSPEIETFGANGESLYFTLASIVLTAFLLFMVKKQNKHLPPDSIAK